MDLTTLSTWPPARLIANLLLIVSDFLHTGTKTDGISSPDSNPNAPPAHPLLAERSLFVVVAFIVYSGLCIDLTFLLSPAVLKFLRRLFAKMRPDTAKHIPASWNQRHEVRDLNDPLHKKAIKIALMYFNGNERSLASTRQTAKNWATSYYHGKSYARTRATELLKKHPDLFNLNVPGHLRLRQVDEPAWSSEKDDEDTKYAFPHYEEPFMITLDTELDKIVQFRDISVPRSPITPSDLRGTGVMIFLPEFLAQLAVADLEYETLVANELAQAARQEKANSWRVRRGSIVVPPSIPTTAATTEDLVQKQEALKRSSSPVRRWLKSLANRNGVTVTLERKKRSRGSSASWERPSGKTRCGGVAA